MDLQCNTVQLFKAGCTEYWAQLTATVSLFYWCHCWVLQVPLHVCTAVAKAAPQQHTYPTAAYTAVMVLHMFFAAARDQLPDEQRSSPCSLQESVLQQVEQSGLLQQLPALMTAAAVELTAQARDKFFFTKSERDAKDCSRVHARQLLELFRTLYWLWPDAASCMQGIAGSAPAVMALALAVTRNVSAEVQEHQSSGGQSQCRNTGDTVVSMRIDAGGCPTASHRGWRQGFFKLTTYML